MTTASQYKLFDQNGLWLGLGFKTEYVMSFDPGPGDVKEISKYEVQTLELVHSSFTRKRH